jgi:hypothetical protein
MGGAANMHDGGRDNSSCQAAGGSTLMSIDDGMHKEQLIARFEGLTDRQNGPLLTPLLLCKDDSTMLQVSIQSSRRGIPGGKQIVCMCVWMCV